MPGAPLAGQQHTVPRRAGWAAAVRVPPGGSETGSRVSRAIMSAPAFRSGCGPRPQPCGRLTTATAAAMSPRPFMATATCGWPVATATATAGHCRPAAVAQAPTGPTAAVEGRRPASGASGGLSDLPAAAPPQASLPSNPVRPLDSSRRAGLFHGLPWNTPGARPCECKRTCRGHTSLHMQAFPGREQRRAGRRGRRRLALRPKPRTLPDQQPSSGYQ